MFTLPAYKSSESMLETMQCCHSCLRLQKGEAGDAMGDNKAAELVKEMEESGEAGERISPADREGRRLRCYQ